MMAEFTFAPLTPASFLDRSAAVFADRIAVIDGERQFTYAELLDRCRRLTSALHSRGIGREDRVAALCTNSHVMLELHQAVPMLGAALVSLNIRQSATEMADILDHCGASILVATHEFADRAQSLADQAGLPYVIAGGPDDGYEGWLAAADPAARAPARSMSASCWRSTTPAGPPAGEGRDVPPPWRLPAGGGDGLPRRAGAPARRRLGPC